MNIIPKKSDKVTNTGEYTPSNVAQIVKGDLLYGYKRITISQLGKNAYRITKSNLGGRE